MIEKALQIKNLFDEMKGVTNLSMDHNVVTDNIEFHIFDKDEFIKIAEENGKRHKVEKRENDLECPYKFTTEHEGVEFFTLANSEEYEYILDKLF